MTQNHISSAMTDTDLVILVRDADDPIVADAAFAALETRFRGRFAAELRKNPLLFRDADNAVQEMRIALLRAARRFNPSRGVKFSTYIKHDFRGAVTRALKQLPSGDELTDDHACSFDATGSNVEASELLTCLSQKLTSREGSVLQELLKGKGASDVAIALSLAKSTVSETIGRIRAKASRAGLAFAHA